MEKSVYEKFFAFDLPIEYKGLKIYPAIMEDYYEFDFLVKSIVMEKNSIPDVKIITMTYLEYLYRYTTKDTPYALFFRELLALVLRIDSNRIELKFNEKVKPIFLVDKKEYDSDDFENIKLIICEQNMVEIPDETIQKEIRDKMEEAKRLKAKMSKTKMGSLEDLVIAVLISTSFKIDDIYNLSIRKFNKIVERLDHKLHYEIYLSASMSGMVKFKDQSFIKHWLADLEQDKFAGVSIGLDEIKSQVNFENLKK